MSNRDGTERTLLVTQDISLPNGLTQTPGSCWVDAGLRSLDCLELQGGRRGSLLQGLHYPFSLTRVGVQLFYSDWRR